MRMQKPIEAPRWVQEQAMCAEAWARAEAREKERKKRREKEARDE